MTEKLLKNPEALTNMVRRIARHAGAITLQYFDEAGYHGADLKGDGSPVTKADQEAEIYIEKELLKILPAIPMVGEESVEEGRKTDLSAQDYFWLVDPLDGTKSFISGEDSFTVNIGLIHNKKPVLGVVFAPARGELFCGFTNPDGSGKALRWLEDTDHEKEIRVRRPPEKGLTVVASKSHGSGEKLDRFLAGFKVEKEIKYGSSLKICMVAVGKADLYPRFGPTCEWDTAAAHAIVKAAGGYLTDTSGKELTYGGRDPKFLNPEFIVWGFEPHAEDSPSKDKPS